MQQVCSGPVSVPAENDPHLPTEDLPLRACGRIPGRGAGGTGFGAVLGNRVGAATAALTLWRTTGQSSRERRLSEATSAARLTPPALLPAPDGAPARARLAAHPGARPAGASPTQAAAGGLVTGSIPDATGRDPDRRADHHKRSVEQEIIVVIFRYASRDIRRMGSARTLKPAPTGTRVPCHGNRGALWRRKSSHNFVQRRHSPLRAVAAHEHRHGGGEFVS